MYFSLFSEKGGKQRCSPGIFICPCCGLHPTLSPNKSLEGFIGNMAASSLISLALRRFFVDALPIPSDHYWVRARGGKMQPYSFSTLPL